MTGSSNKYQVWEFADPEQSAPHGYVLVCVDTRGAGNTPGNVSFYDHRETKELTRPSNGQEPSPGAAAKWAPAGWLRASQRKTDPERTLPWRPWHCHDTAEKLTPGDAVDLDVEIWQTSIVVPPGDALGITVQGQDYNHGLPTQKSTTTVHTDPNGVVIVPNELVGVTPSISSKIR